MGRGWQGHSAGGEAVGVKPLRCLEGGGIRTRVEGFTPRRRENWEACPGDRRIKGQVTIHGEEYTDHLLRGGGAGSLRKYIWFPEETEKRRVNASPGSGKAPLELEGRWSFLSCPSGSPGDLEP